MNKTVPFFLTICLLVVGGVSPGFADQDAVPSVRKVTVTGTHITRVAPDEMRWTISVSVKDATVAKAKARHDASLNEALAFIKSLGTAVKDLQTGGIRIEKQTYFGEKEDRSRPFTCSTQVTFTLTDFDKYGAVTDGLAKVDGMLVQSVDYATSREAALQREALKLALQDARDKANDLAVAARCTIDKPLSIDEQEAFNVRPSMKNSFNAYAASGGSSPGAEAGQIEITSKVVVTYDLHAE